MADAWLPAGKGWARRRIEGAPRGRAYAIRPYSTTRFARQHGISRAANVAGGMDRWEAHGYPVER
jgi:hypothetical protein